MEWLNRANAIYVDQGIPGLLKQYGPKFRDYVTSEGGLLTDLHRMGADMGKEYGDLIEGRGATPGVLFDIATASGPVGVGMGMMRRAGKEGVEEAIQQAAKGPTYRSRLQPAIEAMPQEKMTAQQAQGHFQKFPGGVGSDELEYTGVKGLLDQGGPVTKTGLLEQAKANPLEIKDVVKAPGGVSEKDVAAAYTNLTEAGNELSSLAQLNGYSQVDAMNLPMKIRDGRLSTRELPEGPIRSAADRYERAFQDHAAAVKGVGAGPKYESYTLPGGEDYREMLLTIPSQEKKAAAAYDKELMGFVERARAKAQADMVRDGLPEAKAADVVARMFEPDDRREYFSRAAKYLGEEDEMRAVSDAYKASQPSLDYKSGHYDEPNILAHARYNTRTIDGDKTLFVEEIQSDWHQAGRDKGYDVAPERKQNLEARRREIEAIGKDAPSELKQEWADIMNELQPNREGLRVPNAPYKATDKWAGLAFNRMMKEAVDSGHDRIAWTPGEVQAARYDLSEQIDKLKYNKNDDGTFNVIPYKNGEPIHSHEMDSITDEKLASAVGKEMAEKIKSGEGVTDGNALFIEGDDLKIGGEGMKAFYDKTVKKAADKIAKKYGGKVEVKGIDTKKGDGFLVTDNQGIERHYKSRLEAEEAVTDLQFEHGHEFHIKQTEAVGAKQPVWTMKITPKMREHFGKGVALSGAGLLGLGALPNDNQ